MREEGQRRLGIVVAMAAEERQLLGLVEVAGERLAGPWPERFARRAGLELVIVRSGMGMVNAAAGTEHLIASHRPDWVVNFGCAGAHRRDILPGDVVIGDRAVNHAAVQILASGEERFRGVTLEVAGEAFAAADLPADPRLLGVAREVAAGWAPAPWPAGLVWPAGLPRRAALVHVGPVASADVWTQHHARLDLLHGRHGTLCEDMEAAAVAQVCRRHAVPFLTIKDISNNEYHALSDLAGFADFPAAEVGKRSAALLARLIDRLAESGSAG